MKKNQSKNKKITAIIPARGGSKGLPRKNIRLLFGKPLIAYTIEVALKSKYLDKVIVSTEDKKIAQISRKYGAMVIKRPKELATDRAEITEVIFNVLDILRKKNYIPELIVLLQPTSPLKNTDDIDRAIKLFLKNKAESVVSVYQVKKSPYWYFKIINKYLRPMLGRKYLKKRRQDLPNFYMANGAIYISTPKTLLKYKSFFCKKTLPYIMPPERSIDIDNEIDLKLVELLIKRIK